MDKILLNEIIACMPKDRTIFPYFKGRYALMLLKNIIGESTSIANIRKTSFAALLDKPEVKLALAMAGKGLLTPDILNSVWPEESYQFILTVGRWGSNSYGGDQTSRRGYNLVLQLNFSKQHDNVYNNMVKPNKESLLNYYAHPILELNERDYFRETLAWSRIDLDFTKDEALIEEVQSDWLRRAKRLLRSAQFYKKHNSKMVTRWNVNGEVDDVIQYCEKILLPYNKIWSEAMLAATIEFIQNELGINTIYYHTESTGYRVKKIKYTQPPRSLYSKLPNKFCFSETQDAPEFLKQDKTFNRGYKKVSNPQWYRMAV